jgi:hypothetical protein
MGQRATQTPELPASATSDIAAWFRQAGDQTGADGVRCHCEHDRDDRRRLLGCDYIRLAMGDNDGDLEANELCHEIGDGLGFTLAKRNTMATVCFSLHPRSRSRCTKAAVHGPAAERVFGLKKPIVGSSLACAHAARGHAAAPPTSDINSRRFTRSPRRRGPVAKAGW